MPHKSANRVDLPAPLGPTMQRSSPSGPIVWAAHQLQPHRLRSFKPSRDPAFVAKLGDIVGLYLAPLRHAVLLSVDEKSQIQALDRTQSGLPLKPSKAGTMTHDDVHHGQAGTTSPGRLGLAEVAGALSIPPIAKESH